MATRGKNWTIGVLVVLTAILLVVIKVGSSSHHDSDRTVQAEVQPNVVDANVGGGSGAEGTLTVWVPAGFTGDNFWIYLDGHLVSAPPHGSGKKTPMGFHGQDGAWLILPGGIPSGLLSRNGQFVDSETYRSYLHTNLNVKSGDSKGVFYPVTIPIQTGRYTVEVAYLSNDPNRSSLPFAFSPKYIANVAAGSSTELHIGVPNDWTNSEPAISVMPPMNCNDKPDVSYVAREIHTYLNDPVVQALIQYQASSNADGIVTINLPPALGGSREYDSAQIKHVASAILDRYYNIDHAAHLSFIEDCKNSHPEWSLSLDEYEKLINDAKEGLQSAHKLAGK